MFHTYLKYKERLEEKRFYEFLIRRRQNCMTFKNFSRYYGNNVYHHEGN